MFSQLCNLITVLRKYVWMSYTCGRYLCNPINGGAKGREPLCCCSWWPEVCSWVLRLYFSLQTQLVPACLCQRPCPCLWQVFGEMEKMPCPPDNCFLTFTSLLRGNLSLDLPYCNPSTLLLVLSTAHIMNRLPFLSAVTFYIVENSYPSFFSQLFSKQNNLNFLFHHKAYFSEPL